MVEVFEMMMVILFGISWPMNIIKIYKARSTKGTSLIFLSCVFMGYICGITSKLLANNITYVLVFYFINALMVGLSIILYLRNRQIEKKA